MCLRAPGVCGAGVCKMTEHCVEKAGTLTWQIVYVYVCAWHLVIVGRERARLWEAERQLCTCVRVRGFCVRHRRGVRCRRGGMCCVRDMCVKHAAYVGTHHICMCTILLQAGAVPQRVFEKYCVCCLCAGTCLPDYSHVPNHLHTSCNSQCS